MSPRRPSTETETWNLMSLKTKENDSLSLKHIFDQIKKQHIEEVNVDLELATGHKQNSDAQKDIVKSVSEGNLAAAAASFQTVQSQEMKQKIEGIVPNHRIKWQQEPASTVAAQSGSARIMVTLPHPRAQLTIFYSSMVIVFDDVPADKAHAIMLLATGAATSVSSIDAPVARASVPAEPTTMAAAGTAASPASKGDFKFGVPFSFPTPPASPFSELKQPFIGRPHTELPFARKASLARFLERRKERVQVKKDASDKDKVLDQEQTCAEPNARPPKRICPSS